jgi:SAM-dependent methyltransferase
LELAQVGHAQLGAYNRVAYQLRLAALQSIVVGLPNWPRLRVFEAAFGVGFYLRFFARAGVAQLTGVDLSSGAVAQLQHAFPLYRLFQHDLTVPLPLSPRTFDLVTAIDVLYHIIDDRDWSKALRQVCDLVAPGGALVFTDKFPASEPYQKFAHVRRRPQAMYADVIRSAGLELSAVRPVFVFMDDPLPVGKPGWLAQLSFAQWRLVSKTIRSLHRWRRVRDTVAFALAGIQYPFEKLALQFLSRSPNLEIVTANRPAGDSRRR